MDTITNDTKILTSLIQNKLSVIDEMVRSNLLTTREDSSRGDLLSSVQLTIAEFLKAIRDSDTANGITYIQRGSVNRSDSYNRFWSGVYNDLLALYQEADRIGDILADYNNYVMADVQNLLLQLKTVGSQLANYKLYAEGLQIGEREFIEKFSDLSKIESNSSLLSMPECNIDIVQNVVTLGVTNETVLSQEEIQDIIISPAGSNGTAYGTPTLMTVVNSDDLQLFQYEITSPSISAQKVVLDFSIKLKEETVLNHIRIVPNNFGTKTWSKITAIDASSDGITFDSIYDELLGPNEDNTKFNLAPQASNYAGEGRYSFLPRKIKSIHIILTQDAPFYDAKRDLYSWAIGIKNIELVQKTYANNSELISRALSVPQGIDKISIDAWELPAMVFTDSILSSTAEIRHDISVDDGMTWKQVSPIYLNNQDPLVPEIINVNNIDSQSNPSANSSITTEFEATSIRHKIRMYKNTLLIEEDLLPYYSPIVNWVTIKVITKETL